MGVRMETARRIFGMTEFAGLRGGLIAALWVGLPLALLAVAVAQPWLDGPLLFRDPVAAAYDVARRWTPEFAPRPLWVGGMSTVGAIILTLPVGMLLVLCLAAARPGGDGRLVAFGACGALLTLSLVLDETLMLHEALEEIIPGAENAILLGQAVLVALYLALFRRALFGAAPALTTYAIGLFAMSALIDVAVPYSSRVVLVEDGLKLLAICAWTGAHLLAALARLAVTPAR